MSDLFKKLNVLLKASLNDIVTPEHAAGRPRFRLGKQVDDDIAGLRERINEAVGYEDEIKARIRQFADEAARWDIQADEALLRGDDAGARHAVDQLRKAQRRALQAEEDLREHERVTQELIQRVNALEAAVADARSRESDAAPETEAAAQRPMPDLTNVLREAREVITSLSEARRSPQPDDATPSDATPSDGGDDAAVDDDLEQRRQRLSKR